MYQSYQLNPDGTVAHPSLSKSGFIIDTSMSQTIDGLDYQTYQISYCDENRVPVDDSNYLKYGGSKPVYENQKGLYYSGIIRSDTLVMTFNDLIFPYPVNKGDTGSGHVFYYSNSGNYVGVPDEVITKYEWISTDSLCATPLGDLNCIVYKMAYYDFPPLFRDEVYYFIKPGLGIVGMVQMVYHYTIEEYWYMRKILLTEYQIN